MIRKREYFIRTECLRRDGSSDTTTFYATLTVKSQLYLQVWDAAIRRMRPSSREYLTIHDYGPVGQEEKGLS